MINFVIRGHDLSCVKSIDNLGKKAREVTIKNLQLALNISFPELRSDEIGINPGMGRYINQSLAKYDVQVAILSCYINMLHPDLYKREKELQKFEAYLRHAHYFGAQMVASETGSISLKGDYTEENFTEENFLELLVSVRRLVNCGERHNTLVAIEAGLNHPLFSVERTKQMLDVIDSDYLGIILDPTNLITDKTYKKQVELVEQAFKLYGDKICAVHLKDYIIENNEVIPVNFGSGVIEYQKILDIVQEYKPFCYVVLEETKDIAIKKAISKLSF